MKRDGERVVERVVVMSDDKRRIEEAREQVREYMALTGRELEVWAVNGLETCLTLMDRYIDLIILNYAGLPKDSVIPNVRAIREEYAGRVLLVNEDPSLDACEWGRRYTIDHHLRSIGELKGYLPRVLDGSRKRGKTALVLAGGGILGGFNEAGCLKALYDFGIRDFDMYVGISAGAVVCACAANGAPPEEIIEHQDMGLPDFYYPNVREAIRKAIGFPGEAVRSIAEYLTLPHRDSLFMLSRLLTTSAVLSNRRIQKKLEVLFKRKGATNSFRKLRDRGKELFCMAVDLDSAELRIFGAGNDLETPISEAVAASCALPLCYAPVRIDGRDYIDGAMARTASIDAAIENGADLIVCINPLVPYTGGEAGYVKGLGFIGVIEQAYRTILKQRLHEAIRYYRLRYPHVTIILIEPDPKDPAMFHNPLNAAEGLIRLAALHGCKSTKRTVEAKYDFIKRCFQHHGRPITREIVDEEFEVMVDNDFSASVIERVLAHEHAFE